MFDDIMRNTAEANELLKDGYIDIELWRDLLVKERIYYQSELHKCIQLLKEIQTKIDRLNGTGKIGMDITLEEILKETAESFRLEVDVLKGRRRTDDIVRARQVAMYNMRVITDCSLAACGKVLGGRTPATVSHGFQKIAREREKL